MLPLEGLLRLRARADRLQTCHQRHQRHALSYAHTLDSTPLRIQTYSCFEVHTEEYDMPCLMHMLTCSCCKVLRTERNDDTPYLMHMLQAAARPSSKQAHAHCSRVWPFWPCWSLCDMVKVIARMSDSRPPGHQAIESGLLAMAPFTQTV